MNNWEELANYVRDYALWIPIIGTYVNILYQIKNFSYETRTVGKESSDVTGVDQIVEETRGKMIEEND